LLGLIACLIILVPGAYSIGVGFSAGNGGESVGLWSSYDVGTDVAVREVSKASFDKLAIENARSISGSGEIEADQTYSGSGGYTGEATFGTSGSGSLTSSASLTPASMNAYQSAFASGSSNVGMGITNEGTARLDYNLESGSMKAEQSISTGSARASGSVLFTGATGSSWTEASSPSQGSASIFSSYALSEGVSAIERSTASSNQVELTNSRYITGAGDIYAFQGYYGSNDCSGFSNLYSNGVYGALESTASRSPTSMSANQIASFKGDSVDVSLSLDHQGDSIYMSSGMGSGTITTSQEVWTGSVHGSQNTIVLSESALIQFQAIINSLQKLIYDLEEFSGNKPTAMSSSTTLQPSGDLALSKSIKGDGNYRRIYSVPTTDGSQASVEVNLANAAEYTHSYSLNPEKQEASLTLTADNADYIYAGAKARNLGGDYSASSVLIEYGSISGYSNKAHADTTGVTTSQEAKSVSLDANRPYTNFVVFYQESSNIKGDSATASPSFSNYPDWFVEWSGWENAQTSVTDYSGTSKATRNHAELSYSIGSASGDLGYLDSAAFNGNGLTPGIGGVGTGLRYQNNGKLGGYSSRAYADWNGATASQILDSGSASDVLILSQSSGNNEGDGVRGEIQVRGSSDNRASVSNYYAAAKGSSTEVSILPSLLVGPYETLRSASGDHIVSYTSASYRPPPGGDYVISGSAGAAIDNGELRGYSTYATAKKDGLSSSTSTHSATTSQYAASASGDGVSFWGRNEVNWGGSLDFDQVAGTGAGVTADDGYIDRYSYNSKVSTSGDATSSQAIASARGDSIGAYVQAFNKIGGESSSIYTKVSSGSISSYSDSSNMGLGKTEVSADINADGDSIDITSHAQNRRTAYEGFEYKDSNFPFIHWYTYDVNFGGADFQLNQNGAVTAYILAEAKSNSVDIIAANLPANTKTAIILEPFASYSVDLLGGIDMGSTVVPALVNTGYATTRYTDSAVSKDKFRGLDEYNVILIKSHMSQDSIGLSTSKRGLLQSGELVNANDLNYNDPPSQSLVILAGCGSFEPNWWFWNSALENAVEKANLRAGYEKSVSSVWNQDSIGQLFINMADGMTFSEANSDVWDRYRFDWCNLHGVLASDPNNHIVELIPYGNTNFIL